MLSYEKTLQEIEGFAHRGIHRGLDRVEAAVRLLGHPHTRYPTIHIAGTNGKGSTCAMTAEILKRAGFRTGLTISPHVLGFRERIQIDGQMITEEAVVEIHDHLKKTIGYLNPTYFEWVTLMAFLYFAMMRVDIAVIEAGLGGRWDATNVVSPLVAAITNVSLDHEAYLGSTLEAIMAEKMQILKPSGVAWSGVQEKNLKKFLEQHCQNQRIPLYFLDDYFRENEGDAFDVFNYRFASRLKGDHQKRNAALAVALCQSLTEKGYRVPSFALAEGIKNVSWPARLEVVHQKPKVILDGAHNRGGVEALALFLKESGKKVSLIFGTLKDRPFNELLTVLLPYASQVRLVSFEAGERGYSTQELSQLFPQYPSFEMTRANWDYFLSQVSNDETVMVTGSLYLVSQVRQLLMEDS